VPRHTRAGPHPSSTSRFDAATHFRLPRHTRPSSHPPFPPRGSPPLTASSTARRIHPPSSFQHPHLFSGATLLMSWLAILPRFAFRRPPLRSDAGGLVLALDISFWRQTFRLNTPCSVRAPHRLRTARAPPFLLVSRCHVEREHLQTFMTCANGSCSPPVTHSASPLGYLGFRCPPFVPAPHWMLEHGLSGLPLPSILRSLLCA